MFESDTDWSAGSGEKEIEEGGRALEQDLREVCKVERSTGCVNDAGSRCRFLGLLDGREVLPTGHCMKH